MRLQRLVREVQANDSDQPSTSDENRGTMLKVVLRLARGGAIAVRRQRRSRTKVATPSAVEIKGE
jgi:hypothetical protein